MSRDIRIFCDMDGVVADFEHGMKRLGMDGDTYQMEDGAYIWIPVIEGAVEGVSYLVEAFGKENFFFLSRPSSDHAYSFAEKFIWLKHHFPGLEQQLILSFDKSACGNEYDFIIDDRPHKGGVDRFVGEVIHFGSEKFPSWFYVITYLQDKLS